MRLIALLLALGCLSMPLAAQTSYTGGDSDDGSAIPNAPRAQPANPVGDDEEGTGAPRAQSTGPGAVQDEEAARQRLLKAADQIDLMESNSESNKETLATLQAQLAKLQDDNATLKQQVSTLQDTVQQQQNALDRMRADQAKARQALIDEVAALVAGKTAEHHARHVEDETATPPHDESAPPPHKPEHTEPLAPPPDADAGASSGPAPASAAEAAPETHHPHKGYMYVVKAHETLSLIVDAYRQQGVKVTVSEVRKANGLTSKSVLHVGQKLFIPKPNT